MPKCRVCECTEHDACFGGCEWVEPDLCSTCADIAIGLYEYFMTAGPAARRDPTKALGKLAEAGMRLLDEPMIVIS